jgi:hypothetical protein
VDDYTLWGIRIFAGGLRDHLTSKDLKRPEKGFLLRFWSYVQV